MVIEIPEAAWKVYRSAWQKVLHYAVALLLILPVLFYSPPTILGLIAITLALAMGTALMHHMPLLIARFRAKRDLVTLLTLRDETLSITLDQEPIEISIADLESIRINRFLWWLSHGLVFTLVRKDGYELPVHTDIECPALYRALDEINVRFLQGPDSEESG